MGHLGLTPQSMFMLGGYKIQGKDAETAKRLKEDAFALQDAGCFAVVLECVPSHLARDITQALAIPTIGIGAGMATDGQVLVWQDALGLNIDFKPKFVQVFSDGQKHCTDGINAYITAVQSGKFPHNEHCY